MQDDSSQSISTCNQMDSELARGSFWSGLRAQDKNSVKCRINMTFIKMGDTDSIFHGF